MEVDPFQENHTDKAQPLTLLLVPKSHQNKHKLRGWLLSMQYLEKGTKLKQNLWFIGLCGYCVINASSKDTDCTVPLWCITFWPSPFGMRGGSNSNKRNFLAAAFDLHVLRGLRRPTATGCIKRNENLKLFFGWYRIHVVLTLDQCSVHCRIKLTNNFLPIRVAKLSNCSM